MLSTMSMHQPENWLYEIWQKGQDSPCYVMVPNATDLVKSHLMIAVREEVEVLKEKISELMDKINQLEVENTILKANISQETLQQLQLQAQLQIASGANAATAKINALPLQQQQQQQSKQQQQQQQQQQQIQTQQNSPATGPIMSSANTAGTPSSMLTAQQQQVTMAAGVQVANQPQQQQQQQQSQTQQTQQQILQSTGNDNANTNATNTAVNATATNGPLP